MANPYSKELRERAVSAYLSGQGTFEEVAAGFSIGVRTLGRWVKRYRDTGSVEARSRGGGWVSPIDALALERVIYAQPGLTSDEITKAYNRCVSRESRVHRSSIIRALHRRGFVFKKNVRSPQSKRGLMFKPNEKSIPNGLPE